MPKNDLRLGRSDQRSTERSGITRPLLILNFRLVILKVSSSYSPVLYDISFPKLRIHGRRIDPWIGQDDERPNLARKMHSPDGSCCPADARSWQEKNF